MAEWKEITVGLIYALWLSGVYVYSCAGRRTMMLASVETHLSCYVTLIIERTNSGRVLLRLNSYNHKLLCCEEDVVLINYILTAI